MAGQKSNNPCCVWNAGPYEDSFHSFGTRRCHLAKGRVGLQHRLGVPRYLSAARNLAFDSGDISQMFCSQRFAGVAPGAAQQLEVAS